MIIELMRRGVAVARCDTGDFPARGCFAASTSGAGWTGRIRTAETSVDLDDLTAVYYRRPSRFTFADGMSDADRAYAEAEARLGFGGVLAALDCLWVNNPHLAARAEYKPMQLRLAQRCGLRTPRTLISNEHTAAVEFAESVGGAVVCKTLSSIVLSEGGQHKITYTTPVDPAKIDPAAFATTAHCLQEWVPKAREARVTMVGRRPLAVVIETDSTRAHIDWRADYDALRYHPVDPPAEVTDGTRRYLASFGLNYGAFDFVITPNEEWIMLECNPSGQWLWLEHVAGLPIAAALADLLATGGH